MFIVFKSENVIARKPILIVFISSQKNFGSSDFLQMERGSAINGDLAIEVNICISECHLHLLIILHWAAD